MSQLTPSSSTPQRGLSVRVSNAAIILAMGCLSYGYVQFLARLHLSQMGYLSAFGLFLALEAVYTYYHVKKMEDRERVFFRGAEILTLLMALKLIQLLRGGFENLQVQIDGMENFLKFLFDGEFIACLILFAIVWIATTLLTNDVETLYDHEEDAAWDEIGRVQNTLHLYRRRLAANLFILGALVVFFAVVSRLNLREYVPFLQGAYNPSVPVLNVLLYFALVLVLLSQSQFSLLRARWLWGKTVVAARVPRSWILYGGIFFGSLAILSFLLPTDYSIGLFDTILYAINLFMVVMRFILALILFPFGLCASLFRGPSSTPTEPVDPITPQFQPPTAAASHPLLQVLQEVLFIGITIAIAFLAIKVYLNANAQLWVTLTNLPIPRIISSGFRAFLAWLKGANRVISTVFEAGIKRLRGPSPVVLQIEKFLRQPGGATPRDQILQMYLALLELGKQEGPARLDNETPYAYSQKLLASRPELTPDLLDLTDAFVEARYSPHPVKPERVDLLKSVWAHIRERFRKPASPI